MDQRAVIEAFGHPSEVVGLERCPRGPLAEGHVRIRMRTCAVNPSDLITIAGTYRSRIALPFHPGYEGVGVVERTGTGVGALHPGDRVVPIGRAGSWAALKDCEAEWCLAVPDSVTDEQAAASYVNPMTAWAMLHDIVQIKPGMTIAVTAAGSTIGRMTIRMATQAGAAVFAFVRSDRAATRIAALSAEVIVCRTAGETAAAADRLVTDEGPVDAVLDCVGGSAAVALGRLVRRNGAFVHYGLLSAAPIPSDFRHEHPHVRTSMFHLRQWIRDIPLARVHATYAHVAQLIAEGVIETSVRSRYPLAHIRHALADANDYSSTGKVFLTI